MSQDKEIKCKDCGQNFIFTAGEQEFFQSRGFTEPIRCKSCREIRKSQKDSGGYGGGGGGRW
ncbi:MAG: zinc-ribbon domain-containing protein [Armatimonadota bacterium]